jgi:hypothetical protein
MTGPIDFGNVDVDMTDEEDDPVIAEYPVFLNRLQDPPAMSGEIYLFLNTLRPNDRPYGDQGHLSSVELDDDNNRIRLKYAMNSLAATYDADSVHNMREHTLVARPVPCDSQTSGTHCIGILNAGVISLIPVTALCTVRPDLSHVDEEAASRKMNVDQPPVVPGQPKPVLTGKALHYQQLVQSLSNIPKWKRLDWYDYDSVEAADLINEHVLVSDSGRKLDFSAGTQDEYLRLLSSSQQDRPASSDLHQLSRLDFSKQVERILKQHDIIRFEDILAQLPPNSRARYSESDVLDQLESAAICVQGNWVIMSHLTSHRPQLWDTRDALLLLLQAAKREITIQLLSSISGLGKEDIEEILHPLCLLDLLTNTWKPRVKPDDTFQAVHPDVIKRQEIVTNSIVNRLKSKKETKESPSESKSSTAAIPASSWTILSEKVRSKLISEGTFTSDEIRQFLQSLSRDHFITESTTLELLRQVNAVPIRDRWASGVPDPRNPDLDNLRRILMTLYRDRDALSKSEILAAFTSCQLSDHDLRKLIKEFAQNEKGMWVFRGEPIAERKVKKEENGIFD